MHYRRGTTTQQTDKKRINTAFVPAHSQKLNAEGVVFTASIC
jgi:hypothetical protein